MKKRLILLILLLIPCILIQNVHALSKSEMTTLHLKKTGAYTKPQGYTAAQGGTITDKYIITFFVNNSGSNTYMVALDRDTYKEVKVSTKYNFNHANDATYNENTNEVLIIDERKIHVLNADTLELKKDIELTNKYHAIGYDKSTNQYVLASSITGGGSTIHVLNSNFKPLKKFKIETYLTRQGLTVHNGYVYYTCYEAGRATKYQAKYDGVLNANENAIYVYDLNGNMKNVYYIPYSYNNQVFSEIETMSFKGNRMVIQFNQNSQAAYYTQEIEELNANIVMKLKLENIIMNDNKFEVTLYQDNNELAKIKNKNDSFSYNIKYTKSGTYNYTAKQTSMKYSSVNYDTETKNISVKVTYDPTINKFSANSNTVVFKNTKKAKNSTPNEDKKDQTPTTPNEDKKDQTPATPNEDKKDQTPTTPKEDKKDQTPNNSKEYNYNNDNNSVVVNQPEIVTVPDTATTTITSILGITFIISSILYIKHSN